MGSHRSRPSFPCVGRMLFAGALLAKAGCTTPTTEGQPAPASSPAGPAAPVASAQPTPTEDLTIDAWLARGGAPTFVRGTAGDDASDRAIAAQVELVRPTFPRAKVVDDVGIEGARGKAGWPDKPVVYGGPHVNAALAGLSLPFELSPGKLVLGGESFTGDGVVLMAVIPAAAAHPDLLVYAGTGTPGIAEINSVPHGNEEILVADAFGRLVTGRWEVEGGALVTKLGPRSRRVPWRAVERSLAGTTGSKTTVRFWFVEQLEKREDEDAILAASLRGMKTVVDKLGIAEPAPLSIYVHPDRRSKKSLTGNSGDGHAMAFARALHVIGGAGIEGLVAHEATHVLGHEAWGPAGSPLLGEGLAVWVSGRYGGRSLEQYRPEIAKTGRSKIVELLHPKGFRSIPEAVSYPLAGLLVEALVATVGADNVREHLLGASQLTWAEACERAGTTPEALEDALSRHLAR